MIKEEEEEEEEGNETFVLCEDRFTVKFKYIENDKTTKIELNNGSQKNESFLNCLKVVNCIFNPFKKGIIFITLVHQDGSGTLNCFTRFVVYDLNEMATLHKLSLPYAPYIIGCTKLSVILSVAETISRSAAAATTASSDDVIYASRTHAWELCFENLTGDRLTYSKRKLESLKYIPAKNTRIKWIPH